jgi:hypothetical protein
MKDGKKSSGSGEAEKGTGEGGGWDGLLCGWLAGVRRRRPSTVDRRPAAAGGGQPLAPRHPAI